MLLVSSCAATLFQVPADDTLFSRGTFYAGSEELMLRAGDHPPRVEKAQLIGERLCITRSVFSKFDHNYGWSGIH